MYLYNFEWFNNNVIFLTSYNIVDIVNNYNIYPEDEALFPSQKM